MTLRWLIGFSIVLSGCHGSPTVVAPEGPEPAFTIGDLFIGIDDVKAAYDQGGAFHFLDARPEVDYQLEHIAGDCINCLLH